MSLKKLNDLEEIRYSLYKNRKELKQFILSEVERLSFLQSKGDLSSDDKRSFRYLSYDSNPTIKFLSSCKNSVVDDLNGLYNNCSVQCFNIGKRKEIKRYIVLRSEYKIMTEAEVLKVIGNKLS